MGGGDFRVDLCERDPGPTGADEMAFLIRPNAGLPFAPVAETASGGELSRVALALRTVAHAGAAEPTIVFDEIDAGIGGETAHAVAGGAPRPGTRAQVVTITHLPQIASVAGSHFRVEKVAGDPTHTRIAALGDVDRREELERMLGGAEFIASLPSGGHAPPGSCSRRARTSGRSSPEPYNHLPDWWPAYVGVRPDRLGLAVDARWTVRRAAARRACWARLRRADVVIVITRVDPTLELPARRPPGDRDVLSRSSTRASDRTRATGDRDRRLAARARGRARSLPEAQPRPAR